MKGRTKRRKVPGGMRQVLAENLLHLMQIRFALESDKPKALARAAGLSKSSVQRILACGTGANLESIEALAAVFRVSVHDLLNPAYRWVSQAPAAKPDPPVTRPRT